MRRLNLDRLADQTRQLARQRLEDRVDIRGGYARREAIDQRIVGGKAPGLAQQGSLVAHQVHDLLQVRREQFEVVRLLGLHPVNLGARRSLCQPRDQRRRCGNGMVTLPAHLVQIRQWPVIELRCARLGTLQ